MSGSFRLGSIKNGKERLALVILELLRLIAPEAAYQFRELSQGHYQLELYWGSDSERLTFTEAEALAAAGEEGREALRAQLTSAIVTIIQRTRPVR